MTTMLAGVSAKRTGDAALFHRVADHVSGLITAGTLRAGERVPSVRKLATQLGVSVATVVQAYGKLEDTGWIIARPQSGFYVRSRPVAAAMPGMTRPSGVARAVKTTDLVLDLVHGGADLNVVRLGTAIADERVMPTRRLNTIAARVSRRYPELANGYDFAPGYRPLRVQIAKRAMEAGCAVGPDDIITTCGAQEALNLALRAVTKPGDAVCVESPTFYGILQTIEALHLKAIEIPTSPIDGVCLEHLGKVIQKFRPKACLFIVNYSNPLGAIMPDANKRSLVAMLNKANVTLIEDDIYGELPHSGPRPSLAKSFDDSDEGNVIWCSSVSKTLAPGLRVGWIAPGKHRERVEKLKVTSTFSTPSLPQMTVAEFLANGGYDKHLRTLRRHYATTMSQISDAVQRYFPQGTRLTRPTGGYLLWVEMPKGVDGLQLQREAMRSRISVTPGPVFSASQREYANCIRLSCGLLWNERVENAVKTLGQLAQRQLDAPSRAKSI